MLLLKKILLRFQQMLLLSKTTHSDSKFLIIIFFMCLTPICISSFDIAISSQGNMITLRTMFSSILGYIIEKACSPPKDNQSDLHTHNNMLEIRVLIVGHILMLITLSIIVGVILQVDQNNQSLILLKNTAFSCIGFLVSSARSNKI